jgi:hypothetical protein
MCENFICSPKAKEVIMIGLDEIIEALEAACGEVNTYFDRETGQVVMISEEDLSAAKEDSLEDIPEWQHENVAMAKCIENDKENRFLVLPSKFDIHEWEIMRKFSLQVENNELSEELDQSLHGAGAFRSFKGCIRRHNIEQQWFKYRDDALRKIAMEWCEENGIKYEVQQIGANVI